MDFLRPEFYFDLLSFVHKDLFNGKQYVWDALKEIPAYLHNNSTGKIEILIPSFVHLVNPETITIGAGTVIEPGAFIQGPCIIGKNCQIRQGAYLRGNIVIGNNCVVGHATEIKNSILLNNAHAAHFNYVGDSILGNRINLGAGTICANLKLDSSEIFVKWETGKIGTGLRKLGAIIGDNAQTGCNSVLNPGTLMEKNAFCYPCSSISGYFPAKKIETNC